MADPIVVVAYDPGWPVRFARLRDTLAAALGRLAVRIEHVGSTAVPGVAGKNIIDVQITADPADVPRLTRALLAIGFVEQTGPDPWPPERPMLEGTYRVADAVFGIHCHIVPTTDPDVRQMIEFRDLLRSDPAAREAYARIKRELARQTEDPLAYTHGKTDVIRRLLADRRPTT